MKKQLGVGCCSVVVKLFGHYPVQGSPPPLRFDAVAVIHALVQSTSTDDSLSAQSCLRCPVQRVIGLRMCDTIGDIKQHTDKFSLNAMPVMCH